ncbi:MAG: 50S ribosomal protein L17 [Deltaproteobacteria bacterium GWA2_38_16]|nr:MAG: 50S ribosomal protein L17 [Deltaproteobacteria bacterium GWA2_38_16]OGQ03809.1 MAG: 50S ribosomal protein L17 [Deltaproteobacteria bacterium RIFCSPHIGHO2_02_FULL_38_15]OGQ34297.1 MAG: 50S ribosomal protein L17 [Deltaproteobacteria bacterium RIFCSPLOWO2_01_FULL_38_9]OGQ59157.1 MAG: 50S ribosomal protein L17 [Deltaproteobacteria bacterium RIFCSPLOWO2_12_FULL_38_8]
MRHQVLRGKLGIPSDHRKAMLRNMLLSLLKHERIQTTIARAKQLKRFAEPVIELGKVGSLHAKKQVRKLVHEKEAFHKLFTVYGPRFKDRQGGYTRIFHLGLRVGDGAQMSLIEILPDPSKENEPRIIRTKRPETEEEKLKAEETKKSKKEAKKQDKHLKKQEATAQEESRRAHQTKDITHSHVSQGRKTDKGTGRSSSSKKGIS